MSAKTLLVIYFLAFIFSCRAKIVETTKEVSSFKIFTDSIFLANEEFLKGFDTVYVNNSDTFDPEDTVIELISPHSNILDTTRISSIDIVPKLNRYNSMEQHLDSTKTKMDAKTLELFESIKQKINEIKQPIK